MTKRKRDYDASPTKRFFCSNACPGYATKPRRGVTVQCSECGAEFYRRASSTQTTCSAECAAAARSVTREDRTCAACGATFSARPKSLARFCGAACAGTAPVPRVERTCEHCGARYERRETESSRFCSRTCAQAAQSATASLRELWTRSQPAGQRVEDKVAWAKELLALYEPEALTPEVRAVTPSPV